MLELGDIWGYPQILGYILRDDTDRGNEIFRSKFHFGGKLHEFKEIIVRIKHIFGYT